MNKPSSSLRASVITTLLELLHSHAQPSASELVEVVKHKAGQEACLEIKKALVELLYGSKKVGLTRLQRAYFTSLLSSDALDEALEGKTPPETSGVESSIDQLIQRSSAYRHSHAFQEMVTFIATFHEYSPYNNMLVRLQRPSCGFFATEKRWWERFQRCVKEDASPMLILGPKHPVIPVYDLDQTTGPPLPEKLRNFAKFKSASHINPGPLLNRAVDNAKHHYHIRVDFKALSQTLAGFARTTYSLGATKMRIVIHENLDTASRLGVLCHELAHILCGHLGAGENRWWPARQNLSRRVEEIEAEAVAYIATQRLGFEGSSASYVSSYLQEDGKLPAAVSIDTIAKVAGRIQRMTSVKLSQRKSKEQAPRRTGVLLQSAFQKSAQTQ